MIACVIDRSKKTMLLLPTLVSVVLYQALTGGTFQGFRDQNHLDI